MILPQGFTLRFAHRGDAELVRSVTLACWMGSVALDSTAYREPVDEIALVARVSMQQIRERPDRDLPGVPDRVTFALPLRCDVPIEGVQFPGVEHEIAQFCTGRSDTDIHTDVAMPLLGQTRDDGAAAES